MTDKISVGQYLLMRLHEMGVKHIFGVPGDYNLLLLDQIVKNPHLEWVGNCNELNGAYACDGYARINGIAAMVTTYGVGELSAVNGIAGAFAERVPVVKIVGVPATELVKGKMLMHHTTGEGDYQVFAEMYKHVTHAQTLLAVTNAAAEIDRVLTQCWLRKRPVYIAIPTDVVDMEINAPEQSLNLQYPKSDPVALKECVESIYNLLHKAKKPVVLVDVAAARYQMQDYIQQFLNVTALPFAVMTMAKGLLAENHPHFLGIYCGNISSAGVQQQVEESDCIISFGEFLADLNSGGFTAKIDTAVNVKINSLSTEVKHALYKNVVYQDLIPALTAKLGLENHVARTDGKNVLTNIAAEPLPVADEKLTQNRFWELAEHYLHLDDGKGEGWTIVSDIGTSSFGSTYLRLPADTKYVSQALWSSIGYSVGALLGACLADKERKSILFVGDGSFQLTAQELSTIMRQNLKPLIFVINNDGYTIERYVHEPTMAYQEIQPWNYSALPKVFGTNCIALKVTTTQELINAWEEYHNSKRENMYFVEVVMSKMDGPTVMKKFFAV